MENSKTEKEFHKLLKYEEKTIRQREKTRLKDLMVALEQEDVWYI